jgi:hypothetical protein
LQSCVVEITGSDEAPVSVASKSAIRFVFETCTRAAFESRASSIGFIRRRRPAIRFASSTDFLKLAKDSQRAVPSFNDASQIKLQTCSLIWLPIIAVPNG